MAGMRPVRRSVVISTTKPITPPPTAKCRSAAPPCHPRPASRGARSRRADFSWIAHFQGPHGFTADVSALSWLVVLVIILAFILVSCVTLIGAADKAINEGITMASTETSKSQHAKDERNAPREVTPGKAFTVGKHKTLAGWKVEQDTRLGDAMFSVTGKVKNISNDTSTAFIHFKFIDKSGEVLGNVQCNSADLEPGQTQALNCIPDGKYRRYKRVTAEATF